MRVPRDVSRILDGRTATGRRESFITDGSKFQLSQSVDVDEYTSPTRAVCLSWKRSYLSRTGGSGAAIARPPGLIVRPILEPAAASCQLGRSVPSSSPAPPCHGPPTINQRTRRESDVTTTITQPPVDGSRVRLINPTDHYIIIITRMWANAQPDGRPAEHRWRPLFNAAKFG